MMVTDVRRGDKSIAAIERNGTLIAREHSELQDRPARFWPTSRLP